MSDNGQHPTSPVTNGARYHQPRHVAYRGRVRRVYDTIPGRHNVHRYFVLRYKRGHAPPDAPQMHFGPRGQRHVVAVLVRSDHCTPIEAAP